MGRWVATLSAALLLASARAYGDTALVTVDYTFTGGFDGSSAQSSLIQGRDGNLYGMASQGGTNGDGAIFRLGLDHTFTPLYSFTGGNDGANPLTPLTQASDGNFYGVTYNGGSDGVGAIFRFATNGLLTPLFSFDGNAGGAFPQCPLVQAADGKLYGTARNGGTNGSGAVFRITTNGAFSPIYSFTNSNDGGTPLNLALAADGKLYGVAYTGGTNGEGTIFRVTTNGAVTALYSFTGGADGSYPECITAGTDGNLYGVTFSGGNFGDGAIFRFSTNGHLTPVYSFTGGADGANPEASLMQSPDGNLYGVAYFNGNTYFGGTSTQYGSIYRVTTNGTYTGLYEFSGTNDGANPQGTPLLATDGNFYGTTSAGGKQNNGSIFSFQLFPPPPNDNFSNRIQLAGLSSGFNVGGTIEPKEPAPGGGLITVTNSVWWTWTAPTNGPVSILTAGSSFNTIIDAYTGTALSNLVCIASNLTTVLDEQVNTNLINSAGLSNRVSFTASAGGHYQIQVSGINPGTINIAAQTTALKIVSVTPLSTNSDGSIPFTAVVQVGNSGLIKPGPLQVEVLAHAGYSYNTEPPDGPPDSSLIPPDEVLTNYNLANPSTVAPGATTNITISGVCPAPTTMKEFEFDPTNTLGIGWGIFAVLNEQYDTNWFFDDNALVFYGTWPTVGTNQGPQAGVIRLNPGVGGSTPVFKSAQINGPSTVNQNSTNSYYGTANFVNGTSPVPVNFTNTAWNASRFFITNGSFQVGSVVTNTPVTLTVLYSYNYYGQAITNTNHVTILVLKSSSPSLSASAILANHSFAFTLNSLPSTKFILQAATNLTAPVTWTPLATNTTDANGVWSYVDLGATNRPRRFYRAMEAQ